MTTKRRSTKRGDPLTSSLIYEAHPLIRDVIFMLAQETEPTRQHVIPVATDADAKALAWNIPRCCDQLRRSDNLKWQKLAAMFKRNWRVRIEPKSIAEREAAFKAGRAVQVIIEPRIWHSALHALQAFAESYQPINPAD